MPKKKPFISGQTGNLANEKQIAERFKGVNQAPIMSKRESDLLNTAQVQDAFARQKELRIQDAVNKNIESVIIENRTREAINKLLAPPQETKTETTNTPQPIGQPQEAPPILAEENNFDFLNKPIETTPTLTGGNLINPEGLKNLAFMGAAGGSINVPSIPQGIENIRTAIPNILLPVAKLYDSARAFLTGKQPLAVQTAENSFKDAATAIDTNIEMINKGFQVNPSDAERDFERAVRSINLLEGELHGLNRENLRYRMTDGLEIEASIANEKRRLEQQRALLRAALDNMRIKQMQGQIGL